MAGSDEALDRPGSRAFSRRAFVKGCIVASAATLAAAGAQALVNPLSPTGGSSRRVDYVGATVLGGPAPQGLPLLPLRLGPEGSIEASPAPPGFEGGVLDWYRYCGHARDRAFRPDYVPPDELLRYSTTPEKEQGLRDLRERAPGIDAGWYLDRLGEPLRATHFETRGRGASAQWRGTVPALVLRVDPSALAFEGVDERTVFDSFLAPHPSGDRLMAFVGFCKHFCCIPGWHESPKALSLGKFETVFCACHDSVYDPLALRSDFFVLREA